MKNRDGSSKRELAQKHIVKAPEVLNGIMNDTNASPRHRVDAVKTLDGLAANGPQGAPASDRFQITIVLSADTQGGEVIEHYDKSIAINPNDTSQGVIAAITTTKKDDSGEQEYL